MAFSLFVIASGVLCFSLEKDWFKNVSCNHSINSAVLTKVPRYALLGVSISFAFIYAMLDMSQLLFVFLRRQYQLFFAEGEDTKK